ncbi:MAG: hypothetical protein WC607_01670 [Candidatus Micrarchaeia archaeon]
MAYERNPLLGELPHILAFILLLVVLLVVLTRFGWVHCSQVPGNWCEIYCDQILRSHSRVILLSGDEGLGDPRALENEIRRVRPYTYLEPFDAEYLTAGMLENADLVILERMRTVSFTQALAIRDYVQKGGAMIWIGDAATDYYVDDYELAKARAMDDEAVYAAEAGGYNISDANYYEHALLNASGQRGFYFLSGVLASDFTAVNSTDGGAGLKIVNRNHLIAKGLSPEFGILASEYAVVAPTAQSANIIAMVTADGKDYPGIIETRYGGKVIFVAFPLEQANSTTLLMNILDYLVAC